MKQFLIRYPLRAMLLASAVLTLGLRPLAGSVTDYAGWHVVTALIVPVLVPMLFMLLMLDALMATVWKSQSTGEELLCYRNIQLTNLLVAALLLVFWVPFYASLAG